MFAASFAFFPLCGCVTASSVEGDVRVQEEDARKKITDERRRTEELLQERNRLRGALEDAKRKRDGVRVRRAETTNPADRIELQRQEEILNLEINKLQDQLRQFTIN
jgi:chromosome segregation ATPase